MEEGRQCHTLAALPLADLVPTVQEAGWALGPVWVGTENLAPTWVQALDPPAHKNYIIYDGQQLMVLQLKCGAWG